MSDHKAMSRSLRGLSVGDALGQAFFVGRGDPLPLVRGRLLPPPPWRWSDDTVMAAAIVEVLQEKGTIDQEALAHSFASRFLADTERGYGPMAYWLLHQLGLGRSWREVSPEVFSGQGSLGNGSAMRVAPLGAFFAADLDQVQHEARLSSEVTHHHPDGIVGAQAVALCTAELVRAEGATLDPEEVLTRLLPRLEPGDTRAGLERALEILHATPETAAEALGDGRLVRCSDTVPFALWCALSCPGSYTEAIWLALRGLTYPESDRDTVLAIVGGIVGAVTDPPNDWLQARESLPAA